MAKVWTTTVPNTFDNNQYTTTTNNKNNSNQNGSKEFSNISRFQPNGGVVGSDLLLNGNSNGRGEEDQVMVANEKLDLERSNLEYNEFWNKLKNSHKGYVSDSVKRRHAVKSVPDLTFSWEGVNAFCQKKRNIWKSCWHGVTKRTTGNGNNDNGGKRDREMIIGGGKWDQTRANNDAYFQLNENNKVTAISYRASSSSSASNNSSTTEDSSTIESFSSSTSSIGSKPNFFQVLNNVNGYLRAGECLAIMGASGSGKTTLLNILNFRHFKNFKVTASIKLNGKKINERELIARSAYILQDDLFIPTLTVEEHLIFLAMVKMDPKLTKQEKLMRVEEILDEFNLLKCKNTKIGGVNDTKGISGGEKRRLAFASEILTDPLILFCDEPTSGLDSHMALMIVNTLSKLAKKGKIIISTIHQPSSQVFDKFQKLCLLAEGRVAYFGDREQAFDFFKSMSYECPLKYNPADYYIEVLASKVNKKSNLEKIKDICDSYERSPYHQNTLRELRDIDDRYKKFDKELIIGNAYGNLGLRFRASYLTQFIWLFWRQLLSMLREPLATRILMAQSIIIGIFLGFTYFRLDFDQKGIQNRNGLLFMVLLQICIIYLYGVASNFHEHWVITKRDVKNGVYSIVVYYVAKTLSELPKNVIFPILTVTIVYWLSNIHPSFQIYVTLTTILVFAGNTSVGFGSFLAVIAPNLDATLGIIGPTFFPLLIFSGFLINSSSIPAYFIWIKYISWMFYANEAMMITLWRNVNSIKCNSFDTAAAAADSSVACVSSGKEVLQMLSMQEGNFTFDMAILASMNVFWFTIAGLTIYIKSKF